MGEGGAVASPRGKLTVKLRVGPGGGGEGEAGAGGGGVKKGEEAGVEDAEWGLMVVEKLAGVPPVLRGGPNRCFGAS